MIDKVNSLKPTNLPEQKTVESKDKDINAVRKGMICYE